MTRSTFILIMSIYGMLRGLAMLFIPTIVSKNFGGDPTNNFELALWGFFGYYKYCQLYYLSKP